MTRAFRLVYVLLAVAWGYAPLASAQSVQLGAGSIGVGNMARQGDWAGIKIEFTDSAPTQRELIIQIEGRDSDGDTPLHQRTVTSNPGVAQRTWLYMWIPGSFEPREELIVSAYEAIDLDAETAARTGVSYKRGQLLGRQIVTPSRGYLPAEIATGLVIGRRVGGISEYARRTQGTELFLPAGHEVTEFATDIAPEDLPDRWAGLAQFENIIWTTANPADLTTARSDALIEWVRRGGHLIVCLPATGQIWQDTDRNRLAQILPDVTPVRLEPGSSDVRGLLTHDQAAVLPETLVVHSLETNATAERGDADAILTDIEGRVVVSRRLVDLGMVTLVGIDLTNRNLVDRGLPAMDAFWHRVLGKRGLMMDRTSNSRSVFTNREVRSFDGDIGSAISSSGSAGAALLLGFAVFGLYWAIAGPIGYTVLSKLGIKKHSWMLFVTAIGLFTFIGWGGVSVLRPRRASVQQVVFLDAVDGSAYQRARSYASVFVPGYGDSSVRIGSPAEEEYTEFHPAVTYWSEHFNSLLASAAFPDVRAYSVSARDPDRLRFPARATEKRFRFDWTGERRWSMPRPVTDDGSPGSIRLSAAGTPVGNLVHDLPGPLQDAVIIVVERQRIIGAQTGIRIVSNFEAYRFAGGRAWAPGEVIDLASLAGDTESQRGESKYFDDLVSRASSVVQGIGGGRVTGSINDRLIASAFVSQLAPPSQDRQSGGSDTVAGVRRYTHGLDLGRWLTQPCIIVLGVVETPARSNATDPLPIYMQKGNGWDELDWSGRTVVRWVYPLEPNPPTPGLTQSN
ncbi:MAG: hypothetical protein KDA31_09800 [Phycisphaerales bacterium]|nr:hypothetical protein [Phycisphaerales bacterium]MCB9836396.1 hypothetical protein [Phycisphaera sp.]